MSVSITQTQRKDEESQNQGESASASLPKLGSQEHTSQSVKTKSERNFEIKVDSTALIGFSYQVKTSSGTARGEFPAKAASTIEINDKRLSYTRTKDGMLDLKVDPAVYGITAVIHDKNGGVSRIDLIKNGETQNYSNPHPTKELAPQNNDDPAAKKTEPYQKATLPMSTPESTKNINSLTTLDSLRARSIDLSSVIELPPPPNLTPAELTNSTPKGSATAIPEHDKHHDPIPADILVKAQIMGFDKSLASSIKKDTESGRYRFCSDEKNSIDLGYSSAEKTIKER